MRSIRWLMAVLATSVGLALVVPAAQASETREYAVKAAYLYKFMTLVEWPNEEKIKSFVIGVVGPGPFGPSLDDIDGKVVRGKPVRLVTYSMLKPPLPSR
jgi:hypothetical protein